MPVSSVLSYLQNLLNGLEMPGTGTAALVCAITPPPLFSDPGIIPSCYLWAADGRESRDRPAGTMPRNTGPGTPGGWKSIVHQTQLLLLWSGSAGEAFLFTGMIDAIMAALRTTAVPALVTDPDTGIITQIADTGETITYKTAIRPVPDQQSNQYEAMFGMPLTEVIQA